MDLGALRQMRGEERATHNDLKRWIVWRVERMAPGASHGDVTSACSRLVSAPRKECISILKNLVDPGTNSNPFLKELFQRREELDGLGTPSARQVQHVPVDEGVQVYRKGDNDDGFFLGEKKKKSKKPKKKRKEAEVSSTGVLLKEGRHLCFCMATDHRLLGNCVKCGKIICEQERKGDCLFCRQLKEKERNKESGKGGKPSQRRGNDEEDVQQDDEALAKALAHRDKLLEYERDSKARTHVYDDQADYFSTGSKWMSPEERKRIEELEEKVRQEQHGRKTTITLDLAGRQIREDAVAPTDVERLAHDALEGMKEERTLAAPKFVGKYERENDGKKKKKPKKKKGTQPVEASKAKPDRVQHEYFSAES